MKPYILIVEDQAVIYDGISQTLENNDFEPSDYIKSYDEAIREIHKRKPDLVLLDINLIGEKDGLDLGKELNLNYKIPFIYLTEKDDRRTFNHALYTNHENYLVKAKPRLDIDELVRAIRTCLNKKEQETKEKEHILCYVDYIVNLKDQDSTQLAMKSIRYQDIALFSTKPYLQQDNETLMTVKKNYCRVLDIDNQSYFVKLSLTEILNSAPSYFVRISDGEAINILPPALQGRINGVKVSVLDQDYKVSDFYLSEFNKKITTYYTNPR